MVSGLVSYPLVLISESAFLWHVSSVDRNFFVVLSSLGIVGLKVTSSATSDRQRASHRTTCFSKLFEFRHGAELCV